eukprot:TRINITY_DN10546_c0_g1_i1.p1 TRINITY_DN10546_c0_g1~~TRINITY_DN10546_c0_g1_i1.p1  ORF type:complete len:361 (-),score=63.25 TRINITY_DN10546_c0_g1_i1:25-1107(-)
MFHSFGRFAARCPAQLFIACLFCACNRAPRAERWTCFDGFSDVYTWDNCCNTLWGPEGNQRCWFGDYTFYACCMLAVMNDHDADLPYMHTKVLNVVVGSPEAAEWVELELHQNTDLWQTEDELQERAADLRWTAGFLWTGGYQLLRWFECHADLPRSQWLRKFYIEFGAGIGASSVLAALNGAYVTIVDAVIDWPLRKNIETNLPAAAQRSIVFCQLNWTQPLEQSLMQLRTCSGREEVKYDLIASGTSLYQPDHLFPLWHALSKATTRVLLTPGVSEKEYQHRWGNISQRYFRRASVRQDAGLTARHRSGWTPFCNLSLGCPLLELSMPRAASTRPFIDAAGRSPFIALQAACRNATDG